MKLRKRGILKHGKTRIRSRIRNVKWNLPKKDKSYENTVSLSKINMLNCSSAAEIDTGTSTRNGKKLKKRQIKERLSLMKQLLQEFIYNDKVLTKNVMENWLQQLLSYSQFCSDDEEIVQICEKLLNQLDFLRLDVSCSSSNYSSQNSLLSDIEMDSNQISNQKDSHTVVSAVLFSNFQNLTIQENCVLNEIKNGSNSCNRVIDDKSIETTISTNSKNPFKCNNTTNSDKLVKIISVVNKTKDLHNSTDEKDVSMDISSSQETYYEMDSTTDTDLNTRLEDNQTEKLDLSENNKQETEKCSMIDTSKIINCSSLSEIILTDSANQIDNSWTPEANNGSNIILYTSTLEFTQTEEMLNSDGTEDLNQTENIENINPVCNENCTSKTVGLIENTATNNSNALLKLSKNENKAKLSQSRKTSKKTNFKYPCRSKHRLLSQEIISNSQPRIDKIFKQNKRFSTLKNNDSIDKMNQAPQDFQDINNSSCISPVCNFERQRVTDSHENGVELLKFKTIEERLSPETKVRKTECSKNQRDDSIEKSKVLTQKNQCNDQTFGSEILIQKYNTKIFKNGKNIKLIKKQLGVNDEIITFSGNSQPSRESICINNSPLRCSAPTTLKNSEKSNNLTINGQCNSDHVSAVKINQSAVLKLDKNTSTSDFEVIEINDSCSYEDNLTSQMSGNKNLLFTSEKIDVCLIDETIDEYKAHVQMLLSNFSKNLNKENSVKETSQIDKSAAVSRTEQAKSISLFSKSFIQNDNEVNKFANVNNCGVTVQSNYESVNESSDTEIKNTSQVIEQKIISTLSTEQDSGYSSLCTDTLKSSFKVPIERKVNIKRRFYKKINKDNKNDMPQYLTSQSQDQLKFISGESGSSGVDWIIDNTKQIEDIDLNYSEDLSNLENLTLDGHCKSLRSQSLQFLISEDSKNPEIDHEVLDNAKQTEDTYLNYTKDLSDSENLRLDSNFQSLGSQNRQFLVSEKTRKLETDYGLFENAKQTENTYLNYTKDLSDSENLRLDSDFQSLGSQNRQFLVSEKTRKLETDYGLFENAKQTENTDLNYTNDISESQNLIFEGNFKSFALCNFQKELNAAHKFGFRNKFRKKINIENNSDDIQLLPFYRISPTHSKSFETTVTHINSQINFPQQLFSDSQLISESVIQVANSTFNSTVRKKLITGQKLKEVPVSSQYLIDENYD